VVEVWNRVFLTTLQRDQPCQPFALRFQASRAVRKQLSVVYVTELVSYHSSPSKLVGSCVLPLNDSAVQSHGCFFSILHLSSGWTPKPPSHENHPQRVVKKDPQLSLPPCQAMREGKVCPTSSLNKARGEDPLSCPQSRVEEKNTGKGQNGSVTGT
jgi:hypothetical protein